MLDQQNAAQNHTEQLDILYRDDDYIAINKPSGLLVHRSPIDPHETRFAVQMLREQIDQYVYPVHRLDKPTSGILVFALNKQALRLLSQQFSSQQVKKTYLAIVRGFMPESGCIDHPVKAHTDDFIKSSTKISNAQTAYQCLAQTEIPVNIDRYPMSRFSLVKLMPTTGRRHQLRYHMKHCAHPIIGDAKYGKGNYNRYFKHYFDNNRLLLAATSLTFSHPVNNQTICIHAHPGKDFQAICDKLALPLSHTGILPCA